MNEPRSILDFPHEPVRFRDRADAGRRLAEALGSYRGQKALVLAIPRGGVPVAAEVARGLEAELDIVVARKVGAPFQPELAIGAVTADGGLILNQKILDELGIGGERLRAAIRSEEEVAHQREERFRGAKPAPRVEGRTVLVVDDGLATGATMRAAARSVRQRQPGTLVVAVPVGSEEACATLRREADEVVCLMRPDPFYAVGLAYEDFAPVDDGEVRQTLIEFAATAARTAMPKSASR